MSSSTRLHTPAVATVAAERVSVSGPVSADPSGALAACVSEFLRTWSGALDAIRPGEGVVEQLEGMTDAGVVRVLDQLGAVQQVVEVLTARVMGSVASRSKSGLAEHAPLARSRGYASAAVLLSERWRITRARAATLTAVGEAITPDRTMLGEVVACAHPQIAVAIEPGSAAGSAAGLGAGGDDGSDRVDSAGCLPSSGRAVLSVDGAGILLRELRLVRTRVHPERLDAAVGAGLEHCAGAPLGEVVSLAKLVRMSLDQDGPEPREAWLRRQQRCTLHEHPDGMTELRAWLAPEAAAWVRAGIDALVGKQLRQVRFTDTTTPAPSPDPIERPSAASSPEPVEGPLPEPVEGPHPERVEGHSAASFPEPVEGPPSADSFSDDYVPAAHLPDTRTMEQRRADALIDIFRHTGTCTTATTELAPISLVVRIDHHDLTNTTPHTPGAASIDGITEPISAGTARRMAADARIIPMVLGGPSHILDLGTGTRLFTRAQKLALAERDGGCAWTGCTHPPTYAEAHHLQWWSRGGPTNLDNGILLCTFHHHRIHNDGWEITIRDGTPWFTPPPHIDHTRTPRKGGKPHLPTPKAPPW